MLHASLWVALGLVVGFATGVWTVRSSPRLWRRVDGRVSTPAVTHQHAPRYEVTRETPSGTVLQLFAGPNGGDAKRAFELHGAAKEPGAVVFTADGVERGRVVTSK